MSFSKSNIAVASEVMQEALAGLDFLYDVMPLTDIAKAVGVHKTTVSGWKNGRHKPGTEATARAIIDAARDYCKGTQKDIVIYETTKAPNVSNVPLRLEEVGADLPLPQRLLRHAINCRLESCLLCAYMRHVMNDK